MSTSMNDSECATMASNFCSFFFGKVKRIRTSVKNACHGQLFPTIMFSGQSLSSFGTVTSGEVLKLITKLPNKSSPLDVLHTSLLKSCADIFAPIIAHLANLSFKQGRFPTEFKLAQVLPLLKKAGADRSQLVNYRPISNLSTISKLIERLALCRLRPHLLSSGNFNPLQSAYRNGHSTECIALCFRQYLQINRQLTANNRCLLGYILSFQYHQPQYTVAETVWKVWCCRHDFRLASFLPQQPQLLRQAWSSQLTYSYLYLWGPTRVSLRVNPVCCLHITTQPGYFQSWCRSSSIRR